MQVTRYANGLWRWTAFYEEWRADVGCVFVRAPDGIVLIDPLVPTDPEDAARFWEALDRDVSEANVPVHVLITVFWHARDASQIVGRYGARLHAVRRARAAIQRRTDAVTDVFRPGDPLPGGIQALPTGRSTEVVYWIPDHGALVPGDVILGGEGGTLRLCPQSWLPPSVDHDALRSTMEPLLDLPVERVLVSHGEPVTDNARARLAEVLSK